MIRIFVIIACLIGIPIQAQDLPSSVAFSLSSGQELVQDGPIERLFNNIRDDLSIQKSLTGVVVSRILDLQEAINKLQVDSDLGPIRNKIEELKSLITNLKLNVDFSPIKTAIDNIESRLVDLSNREPFDRNLIINSIKGLLDERLASMSYIVTELSEARQAREGLLARLADMRAELANTRTDLEKLRVEFAPLKRLANWVNQVISGAFWIALKIAGALVGVIMLISIVASLTKYFLPQTYAFLSKIGTILFGAIL